MAAPPSRRCPTSLTAEDARPRLQSLTALPDKIAEDVDQYGRSTRSLTPWEATAQAYALWEASDGWPSTARST